MDSLFNYNMEETKPIFTTASDIKPTPTMENFTPIDSRVPSGQDSMFSPLANSFQSRGELLNLLAQQEPRAAEMAPSTADVEDALMNFRLNGSDIMFDDMEHNPQYFMGSRAESVASTQNVPWSDGSNAAGNKNGEMIDTFDFLIKSLSSANNYVSMLTREQLSLLRCIRPGLLYEFLQEVAKVRSDKRMRRALPNECAFCKNNGENEESYSKHVLKDWRGRVRCPVLRAFRCPRCGATGDYAHTIKYCQENVDEGSDRFSAMPRRRAAPSSMLMGAGGARGPLPAAPAPSPNPATAHLSQAAIWSTFGMN